jgi:hypothetical protein
MVVLECKQDASCSGPALLTSDSRKEREGNIEQTPPRLATTKVVVRPGGWSLDKAGR